MNENDSNKLPLPEKIGPYKVLRRLGLGGMGEVFLVHDPLCQRDVALKQIRSDLKHNKTLQNRFLREAHIAAGLTHPSIIPIYAIAEREESVYYTMPYVQGETLKQIIRAAFEQEKEGKILHPIGSSIPALMRIFLNVCQAIAYAHSRGVLHRDIKPENIIVGKYGEVLILDWGIAQRIGINDESEEMLLTPSGEENEITRPGKIPGTIAYMPPERAFGEAASVLTDIYSLGVLLYQLLTLRLPFQRTTLSSLRKQLKFEKLLDPAETAPYRDIPLQLANITKKALSPDKKLRIQSVKELIEDIESDIEGRPVWMFMAPLSIGRKSDWEFQENVLLAKHIAITRTTELMEWVNLMISKASFSGNTRLEAKMTLRKGGKGLGFLLSIPGSDERKGIEEGDCLWIGSDIALFRSNVEVIRAASCGPEIDKECLLTIEKVDNHLRIFLDGELKLRYLSHIPMRGTHLGVLIRDDLFHLSDFKVFVSSQSAQISCLAVPDAFLADKNFFKALSEYRRIGNSFPGRAEEREALFRAGITLLEEAQIEGRPKRKGQLFLQALEEFGKLHSTPGAPLEYLGKSLVYKALGEIDEEVKCLEFALRKYPKHPLLPILTEHVLFRLHESSTYQRFAAFHFALLMLSRLPQLLAQPDHRRLIETLEGHLQPLPFIEVPSQVFEIDNLAIKLAFWLAKPLALIEMMEKMNSPALISNALFSLLELGCAKWARPQLSFLKDDLQRLASIDNALLCHEMSIKAALGAFPKAPLTSLSWRALSHIFETALLGQKADLILPYFETLQTGSLSHEERMRLTSLHLWAYLLSSEWAKAETLLRTIPAELLSQESAPFYPLYGCFLGHKEGKQAALAHFAKVSEAPSPPTPALLSHYLTRKIDLNDEWLSKAFFFEKRALLSQLALFFHCTKQKKKAALIQSKLKRLLRSLPSAHSYP